MRRVTGLGGVFFKKSRGSGGALGVVSRTSRLAGVRRWKRDVQWREVSTEEEGQTVWSPFPMDTGYFKETPAQFMINYRVADLDALLEQLKAEGVRVDPKREELEFGPFAWIWDPEGNRIELWEPPKTEPESEP